LYIDIRRGYCLKRIWNKRKPLLFRFALWWSLLWLRPYRHRTHYINIKFLSHFCSCESERYSRDLINRLNKAKLKSRNLSHYIVYCDEKIKILNRRSLIKFLIIRFQLWWDRIYLRSYEYHPSLFYNKKFANIMCVCEQRRYIEDLYRRRREADIKRRRKEEWEKYK